MFIIGEKEGLLVALYRYKAFEGIHSSAVP